ncbi:hypothetical protein ACWDUL_06330 [Nocardia niigatensis]|uniref:hypothetical protein n=1 Tax=Nocardia niigatensis TaxID=209249 RepID=UPI0002F7306C|nr:hypothetical protein [Nocardia niigatensis]
MMPDIPDPAETWKFDAGEAWLYPADGANLVDPFIIAAGCIHNRPTDLDVLLEDVANEEYSLLAGLHAAGYDVILVGYDNGAANLETNSSVITETITLANFVRSSEYPLTVGGLGRGALLARYALAKSETERVDTRTGFYVSWNGTPHRAEEAALMERVGWWPQIPVKIKARSQAEVDWFPSGEFDHERIDDRDKVMTQNLGTWIINTIS